MSRNPRQLALRILSDLDRDRQTLDALMAAALPPDADLPPRDKGLLFALVYGVVRRRGRLDWIIGRFSRTPLRKIKPDLLNVLRLGLFQILFMDRIPHTAAVHTAVELARGSVGNWSTGFVNGLLRNVIRRLDRLPAPPGAPHSPEALSVEGSVPLWLAERWLERFDPAEAARLCDRINTPPPLTLRTNTLKTTRPELMAALGTVRCRPTRWSPEGIVVTAYHGHVTEIPAYARGAFQVQDEAAQLVSLLLSPMPGERIMDACAGQGGKSGHLAQMMENRGAILAVDNQSERLKRLAGEMTRLGVSIVQTRRADLTRPVEGDLREGFDGVLLDAPCSGLGVLRRRPDAKWSAAKQDLARYSRRQLRMLENVAHCVRPGGALVYVVCSMEPEETEGVIAAFLEAHPGFGLDRPAHPALREGAADLLTPDGCLKTVPHRHDTDGFFAARLVRRHE